MRMRDSITMATGSLLVVAALGGCSMWNQPGAGVEPPVAAIDDHFIGEKASRSRRTTAQRIRTAPPCRRLRKCKEEGHADQAIFLYEKARDGECHTSEGRSPSRPAL